MRMLQKKSKYAIRALLALAQRPEQEPVLIADLAAQERIPKKFLEFILLVLRNKYILQSKQGRGGGYCLGRQPKAISLGEVIQPLKGPLAPVPYVSHTACRRCDECEDELTCGVRAVLNDVRHATGAIFDRERLADMRHR